MLDEPIAQLSAYEFQAKLDNGKMPDCLIRMPNGTPPLVIDAKFPLESWNATRDANDDAVAKFPARHRSAYQGDFGKISDSRRNPGHDFHVRAL